MEIEDMVHIGKFTGTAEELAEFWGILGYHRAHARTALR